MCEKCFNLGGALRDGGRFFVDFSNRAIHENYSRSGRTLAATDLYAVMVAFIIFLLAGLALGQEAADWRTYILALANAFLVAADAGQLYEKALNPPGASKMQVLKDQAVQQRETKQSNTNQQAMRQ